MARIYAARPQDGKQWRWETSKTGRFFAYIPHWFVIILAATSGIVPWLRWHFSLRTLLIATTLIALVLGLAVYAARK